MNDFRSDPMPSPEGRGVARRAWDGYVGATKKYVNPAIEKTPLGDAITSISANQVSDLVGFWLLWHLYGGFEGLRRLGMSRSSIYRKVAMFRKLFGSHPDEYSFPGIAIDVDAYLGGSAAQSDAHDG